MGRVYGKTGKGIDPRFDRPIFKPIFSPRPRPEWPTCKGASDLAGVKDTFRVQADGYIYASTKPGLGCEIDHDVLTSCRRG